MRKKQFIATAVAGLLALIGIVALVNYARHADDRALKGTETAEVLQVTKQVPAGTPAADLGDSITIKKLPKSAVVPGSITNIDDVAGLVTSTELLPGEQLLDERFVKKGSKSDSSLPAGMQELTIPLSKARLVGGVLAAGDHVGVMVSYDPQGKTQITTNAMNGILVRKVDVAALQGVLDEGKTAEITLAVKTLDAEKIVHGIEWGKVWLTKQDADTDTTGGKTIDYKDVAK